jgi:hypothetical protein
MVKTMEINWHDGFSIRVREDGNVVIISANKAGLLSLSDQLRTLAEGETGDHIHYDEYSSLEDGSRELIIERIPD